MLDTQIKTLYKEMQKYEELKNNLYEDMTDGIISREEYRDIKQTFSKKIETAKNTRHELEEKRKRMLSNEMCTQQWVEEFKQYHNIGTDRIEIHFNYEDEIAEFVECAAMHENETERKAGSL